MSGTKAAGARSRGTQRRGGARVRAEIDPAERLVSAATQLFNARGIHATGIDGILAEAGVARMTLYKHFGSKDGLIREVLTRESRAWFERLSADMPASGSAVERLEGYFNVLAAWFAEPDFKGCAFINAVGEAEIDDVCVRPIARAHRAANVDVLRAIVTQAGGADSDGVAETLMMIADGCTVGAMVTGDGGLVARARALAVTVLRGACSIPERADDPIAGRP
ncbi:TetR/AcrR family transcriptional regulator [uncultured Methylobacterium sp.]|uniref:TetR/AcrR family transcriptional regulator n=1 Tax=uncultured Methylobacterium sp. TaxID=157278 RepID=UPI0035CA7175